ncbi:MAG: DUF3119 family protein [Leptolyngbyaceae cyanobacterium CSU_1_4]|nr:DUF3119 family protein [Leptolyngbyaceae cyanobacterium CSU_1_4]
MTTTPDRSLSPETVQLAPSYAIPITLILAALPLFFLKAWAGGAIALFALFLLVQTATLRLCFTQTALDIYRGESLLRQFPYADWQNWQIFWFNVPVLFYFKEVKSIHFLPILFDAKMLRTCLEQRCPVAHPVSR